MKLSSKIVIATFVAYALSEVFYTLDVQGPLFIAQISVFLLALIAGILKFVFKK